MVLRIDVHDLKEKQIAMKAVSSLSGIEYLAVDMKEKKLTVIGDVDPVRVVGKLKKKWQTELLTVGPAEEPAEKTKDNDDDVKKEDTKDIVMKKENEEIDDEFLKLYRGHDYPYYTQYYYHAYSAEENPSSCVIC
ncbi:hypothetical protein OROGR_010613 [Orobanche gracilis]